MTLSWCRRNRIGRRPESQSFELNHEHGRSFIPVDIFEGDNEVSWENR
jgi:hypothetical protein